jgi:hypothetical protein
VNRTRAHEGNNVREFYSRLPGPVRVGIEATGSMKWFVNLMEELGIDCQVGHPATIRAAEPRRQKHDQRDAELLLKLLVENRFPSIWQLDKGLEDTRRRKIELEGEMRNLARAIADGMDSPSLRKAITERETEIAQLTSKTLGRGKDSVHSQVRNLRKFFQTSMGDLRRLLTSNGSAPLVRMALAKHIGAITVGPDDAGDIAYKGEFKLLGDDCVRWDGAEGQNRTGYAGLFRAALYQ